MEAETIHQNVAEVAAQFAGDRSARQLRTHLDADDFKKLADAGFLRAALPAEHGGSFVNPAASVRQICELIRTLAHGDSSVALVAAMHPTVVAFWLATPQVTDGFASAWAEQRREVFASCANGAWWGQMILEPGARGKIYHTQTIAHPNPDGKTYRMTGDRYFAAGLGVVSYIVTAGMPEGEERVERFIFDVRNAPLDGSTGLRVRTPWDGQGMKAVQAHAVSFEGFPTTRSAWAGNYRFAAKTASALGMCFVSAVMVGIVETALAEARRFMQNRGPTMHYEEIQWLRAEAEEWLLRQAYDGMLQVIEQNTGFTDDLVRGKLLIGDLAESIMTRLCQAVGDESYTNRSPMGCWFQDARAFNFYVRPDWANAHEHLFEAFTGEEDD